VPVTYVVVVFSIVVQGLTVGPVARRLSVPMSSAHPPGSSSPGAKLDALSSFD
jgi:NhaP-type Na+/H+ or K+/H+ antiporter